MRYFDDTASNEAAKVKNGERTEVTSEQLAAWLGGDNTAAEAWELLLDILNGQYPIADCLSDIADFNTCDECGQVHTEL